MFRVRTITLGILAGLAMSLAASAAASAHVYLRCEKVAAGSGKYKNAECKAEGGTKHGKRSG
jgi:hypothetical protein